MWCWLTSLSPEAWTRLEVAGVWVEAVGLILIFGLELKEYRRQGRERKEEHEETLTQMAIMREQALATQASADAANKNIELLIKKERARLQIIVGNVPVVGNQIVGVTCYLNNIGPTTAFVEGGAMALVQTTKEAVVDYTRCVNIPLIGDILANSRTTTQFLLTLQPDAIITDAQALEIREGKSFVHCYGYVTYRDVFGGSHRVQIHLRWFMRWGGMMERQIMEWWEPIGAPEENSDTP